MLKQYCITNGKLDACDANGKLLIYLKPDDNEKKYLIENFNINEHDLTSALDPDELARLDFYDSQTVIILKRPNNYSSENNLLFKVTSIGIFITKKKFIIVMPEDIQILEGKQTKKLRSFHDILLKLIYGTISHFFLHLKAINMMSESLEKKIDMSMENKYLINMFNIQKSLVYYFNGINSNSILFEKIKLNAKKLDFSEDNLETLADIIIENQQCYKQAEIYLSVLSGIMSTHSSIVGNNLNITIHRLTLITTIFMPLSVIAGIGGMSEWTMITGAHNWKISYTLLIIGMSIVGYLTFLILKKMSSRFMKQEKPKR